MLKGLELQQGATVWNYKSCPQKEHKGLNLEETAPEGESPKSEEIGAYRENKDKNRAPAAAKIDSKKKQTSEDSSKTESAQFIGGCIKGFGMDGMAPGVEFHEEQYASKVAIRLAQYSKEVTTDSDIHDSFSKMGLLENLLKGIYQYGLEKPSAVHQRGIVSLCKGFDVIQQSLSETTVTICCGVLQRLDYGSAECQALVVVPTRDIAQETEKIIQSIGQCLGVKAHACAGGYSVHAEKQILSNGVQVLIGTPGRVLDVLQRRALRPDHIGMLVLDEADELLTGGSKGQVRSFSLPSYLRNVVNNVND
ncbi:hypothetical protein PR202_ga06937 [Eleusine coracana subsp. coracana]|uniref:ATP-dependent RNA helicase n=1 Tax=Eleusine coracana subsp. coracana TaxID=191504 RepID=A0AAV5BWM8_ELECO|nr:hypothetical protein PR202_ga06937 [Eleusine coracana subsp. coracana]